MLELVIWILMSLLALEVVRRIVQQRFPSLKNPTFDKIIIVLMVLAAIFWIRNYYEIEEMKQEQAKIKERESLRQWAMLMPSGAIARDPFGLQVQSDPGERGKDFREVFIPSNGGYQTAGTLCDSDAYIAKVHELVAKYDKIPYPSVVLALCMKRKGDLSWRTIAEKAKKRLEFYMSIEPHVVLMESFYYVVVVDILEETTDIEDTGFLIKKDGYYSPKNMP